jgi:hypothetical protein
MAPKHGSVFSQSSAGVSGFQFLMEYQWKPKTALLAHLLKQLLR